MQHIPPISLSSLHSRQTYTLSFLSLTPHDGDLINASASHIAALMPTVLDAVYTKLLSYDITAQAFVPVPPGQCDPQETKPETRGKAQELHLQHDIILRRKDFLRRYLLKLARNEDWSPQSNIWQYMDEVAVLHTGVLPAVKRGGRKGLRHAVPRIEYVHLGLLLAYVEEIIAGAVMDLAGVDEETKKRIVLAWNKVLWIQNDLFARRYMVDMASGERPEGWIGPMERRRERVVAATVGCLIGLMGMWVLMRVCTSRLDFC